MPEDVQGAPAASPQPDALAAPSAESQPVTEQVSEQTPPPTSQPDPSTVFNLPPKERWDQLRQERQEALARADRAEAMARMAMEKLQVGGVAPQPSDYWAGKIDHPDPTTARFYQDQKAMLDPLVDQVKGLNEAVKRGREELAEVKIENFRIKNPDIAPNSEDEKVIAAYVQQGYPLQASKKLALYDRNEAELKALKSKHGMVGQKVAANVTAPTSGIPSTAGLPGKPGDWRENVRNAFRKGGGLAEVINAAGANRVANTNE